MLDLYKNIKARRLELNMTQTDLAKKMGYADKSMIAKIEKGVIDLPQSKILAFAEALQVSPGDLMGLEDIEKQDEESETELPYYINDDAREMAQFMFENPEYKVLFDASRKISKDDIETVKTIMDRFKSTDYD